MAYISDRGIDLKEIKERERSVNYITSSQNLLLTVYMSLDVHVISEQSLWEILKNPKHVHVLKQVFTYQYLIKTSLPLPYPFTQ